jgi:hypothetical protein
MGGHFLGLALGGATGGTIWHDGYSFKENEKARNEGKLVRAI